MQLINTTSQMRVAGNEKVTSPLVSDGESSCSHEENLPLKGQKVNRESLLKRRFEPQKMTAVD
jgi:hypothetical protein